MKFNWRFIYPVLAVLGMAVTVGLACWLWWLGVCWAWQFFSPETFWQRLAAVVLVIIPVGGTLLSLLGCAATAMVCLLFDVGVGPPRRRVWQVQRHTRQE